MPHSLRTSAVQASELVVTLQYMQNISSIHSSAVHFYLIVFFSFFPPPPTVCFNTTRASLLDCTVLGFCKSVSHALGTHCSIYMLSDWEFTVY
jgi:hypothetical protein